MRSAWHSAGHHAVASQADLQPEAQRQQQALQHAGPEVECIGKGKAHKKYEFGCKVSLVSTSQDSWVVGVQAIHGNPYDGHTLKDSLAQAKAVSGWRPKHAYCDKGYRGVPAVLKNTEIHLANKKRRA